MNENSQGGRSLLCAALWAALGLGLCGTRALAGVEADKPSPPKPRIEPFAAGPELVAKMTPYRLNAYTFTDADGSEMRFLLAGPDVQARPGERFPLILFLHGLGEHGPELERHFRQPHIFELGKPEAQQRNPCYIVAPQHPKGGHWWCPSDTQPHESAALAMGLVEAVMLHARPAVDPNRIYITGLSSGGTGALDMIVKFPGVFAACVPISSLLWWDGITMENATNFWYFHNRYDRGSHEVRMKWAALVQKHVESLGREFRIGQYDRSGHDAWSQAYSEPLLWHWVFAQRLGRGPAQAPSMSAAMVRTGMTASASVPGKDGSESTRAVDGLLNTAYVSERNAAAGDYLEVQFTHGTMGPFIILAGDAHGRHPLSDGAIEVSYDGRTFRHLMAAQGTRTVARTRRPARALRVTAGRGHRGPLAVCEILIGDEAETVGQ